MYSKIIKMQNWTYYLLISAAAQIDSQLSISDSNFWAQKLTCFFVVMVLRVVVAWLQQRPNLRKSEYLALFFKSPKAH